MPIKLLCITSLLLLGACSDSSDQPPAPPLPELGPSVTLSAGPIEGQASDRAAAWEWLGLPYAEAPVGDLRWKAPRPAVAWSEPLEAQTLPLECPQFDFFGAYVGAEDCLYLNVWRPQSQARDLPVLVWIHGGANRSGATNWPVYDGAKLAEAANIVVVTVQYRLGPLGWLYYPPLQDGNADDNSGNFGTLDIIATLEWVRDNIALFGGDAENVTAAGESAGGANVLSLMLAEKARGLFHKAIVQSAGGNVTSTAQAEQRVQALLDNLTGAEVERPAPVSDAERAQYLRDTSAEALVRNNPGTGAIYGDGHVLPVGGFDAFDSGDFPGKLPLLIGTNKDEYKLYTNPAGYNVLPNASAELRELVGRYVSDLWRVTGTDSIATTLRKLDDFPDIYAYRFNWGSPDEQGNSPLPPPFGPTAGAHHGAEIPFMFGNPDVFLIDAYQELLYTAQNEASRNTMASVMVDYWGSFIRQGDPNGGNQAAWSPWSNGEGAFKALVLDVNYSDDQPALSTDSEAWTLDSVFDDARSNVEEPLLSQLLPYMNGWIGD